MKRILILTADFGYGHHSAADAISEALQEIHGQECVVEIINLLDDKRVPAFLRKDQANGDGSPVVGLGFPKGMAHHRRLGKSTRVRPLSQAAASLGEI